MFEHLHQISYEELELHPDLLYEEKTVWILDCCSKTIRQKEVPFRQGFVVQAWNHQPHHQLSI